MNNPRSPTLRWALLLVMGSLCSMGTSSPATSGTGYASSYDALLRVIVQHQDELKLTPGQLETLERIRSDFRKASIKMDAEITVAGIDLEALSAKSPRSR